MTTKTKTPRITRKYCQQLFDQHCLNLGLPDPGETCSDNLNPDLIKAVLKDAEPDSRFKVSYDESEYQGEDDSTWDVQGPGAAYGHLFFDSRAEAERVRDALNRVLRGHFGPNPRQVEYSPESHKNKVMLDRMCCPVCGSTAVLENETNSRTSHFSVKMDCGDCNAEWTSNFVFHSYSDLRID